MKLKIITLFPLFAASAAFAQTPATITCDGSKAEVRSEYDGNDVVAVGKSPDGSTGKARFFFYNSALKSLTYSSDSAIKDNVAIKPSNLTINVASTLSGTINAFDFSAAENLQLIGDQSGNHLLKITNEPYAGDSVVAKFSFNNIVSDNALLQFDMSADVSGNSYSGNFWGGYPEHRGIYISKGKVNWNVATTTLQTGTLFTIDSGAEFVYNGTSDFTVYNASIDGALTFNGDSKLTIDKASVKSMAGTINYNGTQAWTNDIGIAGTVNYNSETQFVWKSGDLTGKINLADTSKGLVWQSGKIAGLITNNSKSNIILQNATIDAAGQITSAARVEINGNVDVYGKIRSSNILVNGGGKIALNVKDAILSTSDAATMLVVKHGATISVAADNTVGHLYFAGVGESTINLELLGNAVLELDKISLYEDTTTGQLLSKGTLSVSGFADNRIFVTEDAKGTFENNNRFFFSATVDGKTITKEELQFVAGSFNGTDGYWVNLAAVPEPAEWAAIIGAIALGFAMYRRRNLKK